MNQSFEIPNFEDDQQFDAFIWTFGLFGYKKIIGCEPMLASLTQENI